jgi:hypothetical protein
LLLLDPHTPPSANQPSFPLLSPSLYSFSVPGRGLPLLIRTHFGRVQPISTTTESFVFLTYSCFMIGKIFLTNLNQKFFYYRKHNSSFSTTVENLFDINDDGWCLYWEILCHLPTIDVCWTSSVASFSTLGSFMPKVSTSLKTTKRTNCFKRYNSKIQFI